MKKEDFEYDFLASERALRDLGFMRSHVGTQYLAEAVEIAGPVPECGRLKAAYFDIARAHDTTWSAVEKNIRAAIRAAVNAAEEYIEVNMAWTRICGYGEYTAAEVIYSIARECFKLKRNI